EGGSGVSGSGVSGLGPSSWVETGQKQSRFKAKFQAVFLNFFFTDEICQYIAEQTNLYAIQQFNQKTMLGKMKRRSREKDWVPTNKDEMKILFGLLLLQGIVQKPTMGHFFTRNRLLATPIFYETMPERDSFY
ncbi:hypothetical protein C0J52_18500, partial [Blattella germanica]